MKKWESASTNRQLTNYATNSDYDGHGGMFVMRHKAHSIKASNPINTIWFVDSRASNHTTSHRDWLWELRKLDRPDYVETEDGKTHSIQHFGNVPFENDDKQTYLKNVLYVPTITRNMVSVDQIVEQDMQVWFNHEGCFNEKDGLLIAWGRREGRMSFLIQMRWSQLCSRKASKLVLTWKCGKKELATSISRSSRACGHRESSSDSQLLQRRRLPMCVKLSNPTSDIDNRSRKRGT